jgi:hypothetical protein
VGGVLRNIPPGAGKRKSKGSSGSERRTCSQNTPFQKVLYPRLLSDPLIAILTAV